MAPTPLQYSVEDCDYETPAEGSIQQRIDLLSLHTSAVHGVQQQHVCQPSSRLDKLPWPVFTPNMTGAAWDYKVFEQHETLCLVWEYIAAEDSSVMESHDLQSQASTSLIALFSRGKR